MNKPVNTEIYLRRRNRVIVSPSSDDNQQTDAVLVALQKNIESLGYSFSSEALKTIGCLNDKEISAFYTEIIGVIKQLLGGHVKHKPMYPNFPKQVADLDEVELYVNAQLHYFGDWLGVRILPEYEKLPRDELTDTVKFKIINLGDSSDFNTIFTNLVQAKTSISDSDKKDVEWFIENLQDDIVSLLPEDIPNKENLAVATSYILRHTELPIDLTGKRFKTATDVLRLVTALSEGDVSLAEKTKYKSFNRSERRMILGLLENCGSIIEDMLRYKEQWKRVGERLHPTEYTSKFPNSARGFEVLRDDIAFETFNSKLEKSIQQKDVAKVLELLKSRPGELARRLDHLLRTTDAHDKILGAFSDVAPAVASPVLLQLFAHFKERNRQKNIRTFFPKGDVGKAQAIQNNLPKINEESRQRVMTICKSALSSRYAKLKPLGKVYIDRELKNFTVPFALRSASKALKTLGRGSHLKLPEGNTVRFFIWWRDGIERTDLDLSALALDEHSIFKMQITYYNLKELGGYHSGDITSAPDGASEFIDMEVDKMLKAGVRYIVMSINSYTQQPFYDLPECFAGFMIRQSPQSGEIYDPRTVGNKIDITANTRVCLPFIIDLKDKTVIWTDLAVKHNPSHNNNVINNMSTLTIMNDAMLSLVKPSLHDLFTLHAEARGEIVKKKKEADTVFSLTEGITPFDSDRIVGEYL